MIKQLIRDKTILILGFGKEGQSTYAMVEQVGGYASLTVADQSPLTTEVGEGVATLIGDYSQERLNDYDIVIKSPGVVLQQEVGHYTCQITSQTDLFLRKYRSQIIGITGTKGKSTTATLLHHVLKSAGTDCVLVGNIGIPALDVCDRIHDKTIVVYELSCHQLEHVTQSPATAVLLNLFEDHLDHYGTVEKYIRAKQNIYAHQQRGDLLLCHKTCAPTSGACGGEVLTVCRGPFCDICVGDHTVTFAGSTFHIPRDEISLLGKHNDENIAFVYVLATRAGLTPAQIARGLKTYVPLPHRLQWIATVDGVGYYDDSISTICESAIQALESIPNLGTILVGGMDRGIDYHPLIAYFVEHPIPNIILMYETGERIYREMNGSKYPQVHLVADLAQAVALAKRVTPPGQNCVMSPAAASYGHFQNFEHRGDMFRQLVKGGNV